MSIVSRAGLLLVVSLLLTSCGSTKSAAAPFAKVSIVNSGTADVLVIGCPICKAGGARLEGDPSPNPGGGLRLGWTVSKPGPLTYTVVIKGRHVVCRPPKPIASTAPTASAGPAYQLAYNISQAGRCVVLRW